MDPVLTFLALCVCWFVSENNTELCFGRTLIERQENYRRWAFAENYLVLQGILTLVLSKTPERKDGKTANNAKTNANCSVFFQVVGVDFGG